MCHPNLQSKTCIGFCSCFFIMTIFFAALLSGVGSLAYAETCAAAGTNNTTNEAINMETVSSLGEKPLVGTKWEDSPEMNAWAKAERELIVMARSTVRDMSAMTTKIDQIYHLYEQSESAVHLGLLDKRSYYFMEQVIIEWNKRLYQNKYGPFHEVSPPGTPLTAELVADALEKLELLDRAGKLQTADVESAILTIYRGLPEELDDYVKQEVSVLPIVICGYRGI